MFVSGGNRMQFRQLGNSDLQVSVIGLGGNNFGWWSDRETSAKVIHRALDLGVNFIDTADMYDDGRSEDFIGSALKGVRQEVILATKFGAKFRSDPSYGGASRSHIMRAVDASLKRLQTDYLDLYQIHTPDPETPLDETLRALEELVQAGKVRYIGCSNFPAALLEEALNTSKTLKLAAFVSLQARYNMLERDVEKEAIPSCREHHINFIPWGPLAGGFLTGKYREDAAPPEGGRLSKPMPLYDYLLKGANWGIIEGLRGFAENHGHTMTELAIAWLLANDCIATVIPGAKVAEQVDLNVTAASWELSAAEMAEIEQILRPA
jgi:aryl-alcohol dehydrogenase-like predicted oxidoreductase